MPAIYQYADLKAAIETQRTRDRATLELARVEALARMDESDLEDALALNPDDPTAALREIVETTAEIIESRPPIDPKLAAELDAEVARDRLLAERRAKRRRERGVPDYEAARLERERRYHG